MAYDGGIYGLTMNSWHRPGQVVDVLSPSNKSDYGIGSLPDGYDALLPVAAGHKGSCMVAVGDTVVLLGGHFDCNFINNRSGYGRARLVGTEGGRNWTRFSLDSPWTWPVIAGAYVQGSRIWVAVPRFLEYTFVNESNAEFADPGLYDPIELWYSDDLGATWFRPSDPVTPCGPGSDNTNRATNYDLILTDNPTGIPSTYRLGYCYGSCFHNGYFVVLRERAVKWTGSSVYKQSFCLYYHDLSVGYSKSNSMQCSGWVSPAKNDPTRWFSSPGGVGFPTSIISFPDRMLTGGHCYTEAGTFYNRGTARWEVDFSDPDNPMFSHPSIDDYGSTALPVTNFGTCAYRNQRWVIGGKDIDTGSYSYGPTMSNRIFTSLNGVDWEEVSFPKIEYPNEGHQNTPLRCEFPLVCFIPDRKELLIGYSWIGQEYYDNTQGYWTGSAWTFNQMDLFRSMMHSDSIPFPEEVPVETPWYNFPIGGEPGIFPDAPGMSADFSETGDVHRCLKIHLETGQVSAGAGFPFVSTLQNSSPTALPGQLPDKMLAGDKNGYLNKAMCPEAAGLGVPSKFVLWYLAAGSTVSTLVLDVDTRRSYLPAGFLVGLPVRIYAGGSQYDRTIVANGNDTITLDAEVPPVATEAGLPILIAPMDCAALLSEMRYQYPARLAQIRINVANYQPDEQSLVLGLHTASARRRFGDFSSDTSVLQTIAQSQIESGGGVVGVVPCSSRSLAYDLRFIPNGGGNLEIGPIHLTEFIQAGDRGVSA